MGWYTYCPHCGQQAKYAMHSCGCIAKENERILKLFNQCHVVRMFHYDPGVPYVEIYWHIEKAGKTHYICYVPPQTESLSCYTEVDQTKFNEAWNTTEFTTEQYEKEKAFFDTNPSEDQVKEYYDKKRSLEVYKDGDTGELFSFSATGEKVKPSEEAMALSGFRFDNEASTKKPIQFCQDFQESHCSNTSCPHVHGTIAEEETFLRSGVLPSRCI